MVLKRLDAELVRRGLAKSREAAKDLIEAGVVKVNGGFVDKPARQITTDSAIVIVEETSHYVSRGAHKLIGALDKFKDAGLEVINKIVLDAGASTGGFTQVCLERGASKVIAIDVGYGQIAWELRNDPKVIVIERFNIRYLTRQDLEIEPNLVVADLSFISLATVLPAIQSSVSADCDYVLMVKPQFEVGKKDIGSGVVTDPQLRIESVLKVCKAAADLGLETIGVGASPLPGPSGNVEYFIWLNRSGTPMFSGALDEEIQKVVKEGPQ